MYTILPRQIFPLTYFTLLIFSAWKSWSSFDVQTLEPFRYVLADPYKPIGEGIANFALLSALLYFVATYLFVEDLNERGQVTEHEPSRLATGSQSIIRVTLIAILSLKAFVPTLSEILFGSIIAVGFLLIAENLILQVRHYVYSKAEASLSINSIYKVINRIPTNCTRNCARVMKLQHVKSKKTKVKVSARVQLWIDFFCAGSALFAILSMKAQVILHEGFAVTTLIFFVVFLSLCTGAAIYRFWLSRGVVVAFVSSLVEGPRVVATGKRGGEG